MAAGAVGCATFGREACATFGTGVRKLVIKIARQRPGDSAPYCPTRPRSTMLSGRTAARIVALPYCFAQDAARGDCPEIPIDQHRRQSRDAENALNGSHRARPPLYHPRLMHHSRKARSMGLTTLCSPGAAASLARAKREQGNDDYHCGSRNREQ